MNRRFPTSRCLAIGRSYPLAARAGRCGLVVLLLGTAFPMLTQARLNVVATTPDLAALAREIGGDLVQVTSLAKPTEDPHFVQTRPSFVVQLNRADVLIEGGMELELGWLPAVVDQTRNRHIQAGGRGRILAATGIEALEVPTGPISRDRGDLHALGNPHFLTDPLNGRVVAANLCEAFCRLEPSSCERFRANLQQFEARLAAKLTEWEKRLAPHRGKRIVAYHNTWPYFARRFGLRIDLFLEPKPGIPPTPANLAQVIRTMKAENIRVILCEPYLNHKTAETVARDTGAVLVEFTQYPGGVPGSEGGYIELLDYLVRTLADALEPKT